MIDLLPWRQRLRNQRRRRFLGMLMVSILFCLLFVLFLDRGLHGSIAARNAGNHRLRAEIGLLGARGDEAERLRQEQEDAALHMQGRRLPAQVLSELSAELPAAAYYHRLSRSGGEVRIEGLAESHAAVAELMRGLSASPRFVNAQLSDVAGVAPTDGAPELLKFSLLLRLDAPES